MAVSEKAGAKTRDQKDPKNTTVRKAPS